MTVPQPTPRVQMYLRLTLAVLLGFLCAPLLAADADRLRVTMSVTVDEVGNATVQQQIGMPKAQFIQFKQNLGDPLLVMHAMEAAFSWMRIEDLQATFNDAEHAVQANFHCTGLSRTQNDETWGISLREEDGFELLDIYGQQAVFTLVDTSSEIPFASYIRVHLPAAATDIRYDVEAGTLLYHVAQAYSQNGSSRAQFEMQATEHLLGSLAMMYGRQESDLFAARSQFHNAGNAPVRDYRVRFRVTNFSGWSEWKRTPVVHAGQTVVDPYHPVFDIDRIAAVNGTRHVMIEVEYSYVNEAGESIRESDARRTQLLSRNEVVYSKRSNSENLTWFDRYDLAPYILAAFTNGADPVVQQWAGRVSARAGGLAAAANNEQAIQYLRTMWEVLQANGVAYQTPPSYSINDHFGQHVKFARDVLRNRAGTCIDLAILWASAAESVGLRAHITVLPGHAFPVIELPSGDLFPIESTMLKKPFEEAVKVGFAELAEVRENGLYMLVDIAEQRTRGARSLDLPSPANNILASWGYSFEPVEQHTTHRVSADEAPEQRESRPVASAELGLWEVNAHVAGYHLQGRQLFLEDGRYFCVLLVTDPDGNEEKIEEEGTYIDRGNHFEFDTNLGQYTQRYQLAGEELLMEFQELESWVRCVKVEEESE